MHELKFYTDERCQTLIKKIEWDGGFSITLENGEKLFLKNAVKAGEQATATIFIRNESKSTFAIKKLSFTDRRIQIGIENSWLLPMQPTKLILSYDVPSSIAVTESDTVLSGFLKIEGFFVLKAGGI